MDKQTRSGLPTYWIALGLIIALIIWLSTGRVDTAQDSAEPPQSLDQNTLQKVAFTWIEAETIDNQILIQGQVEPLREVILNSRLETTVASLLVKEGDTVEAGQTLATLAKEGLPSQLAKARAQVALADSELKAARSLFKRGLSNDTELQLKQASLSEAQAEVDQMTRQLQQTSLEAPFDGHVEVVDVEVGETVRNGSPVLSIIDDSQVKLVGQVPQQHIGAIKLGMPVTAELLNKEVLKGKVSFIGRRADSDTRTFRVEAILENRGSARVIGATARLAITTGQVQAHRISPAMLKLDDQGRLAVEHLGEEDRVVLSPVERAKATNTALWVTGLPERTRLITLGRGFVTPGSRVSAVEEGQLSVNSQEG